MKKDEYKVLKDLYYTKEHEWIRIKSSDYVVIGITDYAQKNLHEIVYVDLPKVGLTFNQMDPIGTVESVKSVSEIYSPITGEIIKVNEKLVDSPELVNKSPYEEGWIAVMKPKDLDKEMKNLLSAEQYERHIGQLIEKL
ncbi:MAG: glycine cleavage system protein GcvH [Candidatus Bathyarchaeia archaeon]